MIVFLPKARADFDEAHEWYAARSPVAAQWFSDSVDDALKRIIAAPQCFMAVELGCRSCSLNRFPYRIIYYLANDYILIVAISHSKRDPSHWNSRLLA